MPDEAGISQIHCATYTHARRHPMVLGRIAGWTPPFQLSLTQIGVLLVSFWAMVQSWRWWAPALPSTLALIIGAGVPIGLTWAVRRVRVEGRSLPRAALGWLTLWSTSPKGVLRGKPNREHGPVSLRGVRMNVLAVPEEAGPVVVVPAHAAEAVELAAPRRWGGR
jgi:hypothetical protein